MGLLLDARNGDKYVSRVQLAEVETPECTDTWHPIPHIELVNAVDSIIQKHDWSVREEKFGLVRDQKKMFGVMTLEYQGNPEYTRCIGIRNSHDKSLCAGITAGVSVLVCSNLCFGGTTVLQRRHTSGIDIGSMVEDAVYSLIDHFFILDDCIDTMKRIQVSDDDARSMVVKAAENNVIPSCDILPVFREFKHPRHDDFREPTRWSLFNAFTEIAHKYAPSRSDLCHRGLSRLFGLERT